MKKSQRLQVIIDLKENQEKKYLEALGVEQLKKQQKAEQLNNLQSYHQDYVDKNAAQLAKGLAVLRLFVSLDLYIYSFNALSPPSMGGDLGEGEI